MKTTDKIFKVHTSMLMTCNGCSTSRPLSFRFTISACRESKSSLSSSLIASPALSSISMRSCCSTILCSSSILARTLSLIWLRWWSNSLLSSSCIHWLTWRGQHVSVTLFRLPIQMWSVQTLSCSHVNIIPFQAHAFSLEDCKCLLYLFLFMSSLCLSCTWWKAFATQFMTGIPNVHLGDVHMLNLQHNTKSVTDAPLQLYLS